MKKFRFGKAPEAPDSRRSSQNSRGRQRGKRQAAVRMRTARRGLGVPLLARIFSTFPFAEPLVRGARSAQQPGD